MEYKCSKCGREAEEKESCCGTEMAEKTEESAEKSPEVSVEMPKEEETA